MRNGTQKKLFVNENFKLQSRVLMSLDFSDILRIYFNMHYLLAEFWLCIANQFVWLANQTFKLFIYNF